MCSVSDQILFTFDLQYAQLFLYECLDVYTLHTSLHVSSRSTHHQELCNFGTYTVNILLKHKVKFKNVKF
jgi:hypothetical protein